MKTLSVYQKLIRNCLIHDAKKWDLFFRVVLNSHSVNVNGEVVRELRITNGELGSSRYIIQGTNPEFSCRDCGNTNKSTSLREVIKRHCRPKMKKECQKLNGESRLEFGTRSRQKYSKCTCQAKT